MLRLLSSRPRNLLDFSNQLIAQEYLEAEIRSEHETHVVGGTGSWPDHYGDWYKVVLVSEGVKPYKMFSRYVKARGKSKDKIDELNTLTRIEGMHEENKARRYLEKRGIIVRISRNNIEHGAPKEEPDLWEKILHPR